VPVPLYEYACRGCARTFEALVRRDEPPSCPTCGSHELTRLLSVVSVGGRAENTGPMPGGAPCGTCGDPRGPGSCAS
jgi:putative FmdB family regulatory protein